MPRSKQGPPPPYSPNSQSIAPHRRRLCFHAANPGESAKSCCDVYGRHEKTGKVGLRRHDLLKGCMPDRQVSHSNTTWPFTCLACFPATILLNGYLVPLVVVILICLARSTHACLVWLMVDAGAGGCSTLHDERFAFNRSRQL